MYRLKQLRDRYRGIATMHAKVEVIVRRSQRRAEAAARDSAYFASGFQSLMKRELNKSELEFERREAAKQKSQAETYSRDAGRARIRADYHAKLSRKYERAASRPWQSVGVDPTEPPWP
jgi:hypothetical protein